MDLSLHAIRFQNRFVARVEFDPVDEPRLHHVYEFNDALVFVFRIDANGSEIFRQLIAKNALHEIEVAVN